MTYIDYNGFTCSLNDFFDDNIIDSLVRFDDDAEYLIIDKFEFEGSSFIELERWDGELFFLSEDFFVCQNLSDYFDEEQELSQLFPTNICNPWDGYEDYLYDMARDKELLGW